MENTFSTEHIPLRTNEIQDTIFREHVLFSFLLAGENSMRVYFLLAGENSVRGFLYFLLFVKKKGFENTLFQTRSGGKYPPFRTNIFIYNILYKRTERRKRPKGITIHTVSSQFFLFETKN